MPRRLPPRPEEGIAPNDGGTGGGAAADGLAAPGEAAGARATRPAAPGRAAAANGGGAAADGPAPPGKSADFTDGGAVVRRGGTGGGVGEDSGRRDGSGGVFRWCRREQCRRDRTRRARWRVERKVGKGAAAVA